MYSQEHGSGSTGEGRGDHIFRRGGCAKAPAGASSWRIVSPCRIGFMWALREYAKRNGVPAKWGTMSDNEGKARARGRPSVPRFHGRIDRCARSQCLFLRPGEGDPTGVHQEGPAAQGGIAGADVRRRRLVPAPTYLIGIDEPGEVGYIVPILEGMGTTFPASQRPTRSIRRTSPGCTMEVERFWSGRDMARRSSVFSF